MRRTNVYIIGVCLTVLLGCKLGNGPADSLAPKPAFVTGADVSWLTELEDSGRVFRDRAGQPKDLFAILKGYGMSAIRLRVWVNPPAGYSGTADVVRLAKRATAAGMDVMVDFHYSDGWADPGKQYKPAAWAALPFTELKGAVYNHTLHVLNNLRQAGVYPRWVQVGNETRDGMLWPDGKASAPGGFARYAALIDTGYAAVKAVDKGMLVIVHCDNGWDNGLFRWHFDSLAAHHARFDVMGMSLYPDSAKNAQRYASNLLANMADMYTRHKKPMMLCEVGMDVQDSVACKALLTTVKAGMLAMPAGRALGILYWEPEAYRWRHYDKVAFGPDGRPTQALEGLR